MNQVNIKVDATETASQVIKGVADTTVRAETVIVQSMGSTEQAFDTAARSTGKLGERLDKVAGFSGNMADGIGGAAAAAQSLGDIMSYSARKAEDLKRAQTDVAQAAQDASQAMEDLEQANRDAAQAGLDVEQAAIDLEQALIDQTTAQEAYNAAVKKHGKDSTEAKQALTDLRQAQLDAKQATEDSAQAERDLAQANLDTSQAVIDNADAQNRLSASQRELAQQGTALQKVSEWGGMLSGVLGGLVGVIGAITAVQWAWNASLLANPVVLIIVAIIALIAVIVLIATKTTWFQDLWNAIWSKIGDPLKAAWEFIKNVFEAGVELMAAHVRWVTNLIQTVFKFAIDFVVGYFKFLFSIPGKVVDVFKGIGESIFAPFKWAFNSISNAWNRTVGKLSFTIPGWVPGLGGNSFSMPRLPTLAVGGEITRTGAVFAHKGERIMPASTRGLFNDVGEKALKIIVEILGGHDAFHQFIVENVKIYGAGDVNSAYSTAST